MRRIHSIGLILTSVMLLSGAGLSLKRPLEASNTTSASPGLRATADFGRLPLYFVANRGQADAEALYYAKTPGATLWLTKSGMVFDSPPVREVVRIDFVEPRPEVRTRELEPAPYRVHYFEGRDPSEWRTDIPTSRAVLYEELFPRIDLKVYGRAAKIEYDWIVKPGGNPDRIGFAVRGADRTELDREGNLVVETARGTSIHGRPRAFQEAEGRRVEVEASYARRSPDTYGIRVGPYDPNLTLVIDPYVQVFSTYLGGSQAEYAGGIAVDGEGAVYVSGYTESKDFPTLGSKPAARMDAFVSKFSKDGTSLVYSSFFPLARDVTPRPFLAVDSSGSVYLTGSTASSKFPIKNAFQSEYGGGSADGFVLKLTPKGNGLVYGSFLGGASGDYPAAIAVNGQGEAVITGSTASGDFPIRKAVQPKYVNSRDVFVAKVAGDGKSLVFSTYLGGANWDEGRGIALGPDGSIFTAGYTESRDFPVKNAYQPGFKGSQECFLVKLQSDGQSLDFSTFLGGPSIDYCYAVAVDSSGSAVVTGFTIGSFPLKNAFQSVRKGSNEGFVTKFAPDGRSLAFSSYLGGTGMDEGYGVALRSDGTIGIAGATMSRDFPKKGAPFPSLKGKRDGFLAIVSADGKRLISSTYLGGSYHDYGTAIAVDASDGIYITGNTNSTDFPLKNAYQSKFGGGDNDVFVIKLKKTR